MQELPNVISVFHVKSTVLMPKTQLPVVISEKEYETIAPEIVENNIIGIVQPFPFSVHSTLCKSGCAGRVNGINQIDEDIIVNVYGICRFDVNTYIESKDDVEKAVVSYEKYVSDLEDKKKLAIDKERLFSALDTYFRTFNIAPNWKEIEETPDDVLISALAMACPLHPAEKQSLLETASLTEMSQKMIKMIEIDSFNRYNTDHVLN